MVDQRTVDPKAEEEAAQRARALADEWRPAFTPEQLATPPSWIPPAETEEARAAREAQGLPEPRPIGTSGPLMTMRTMQPDQSRQGGQGETQEPGHATGRAERERQEREKAAEREKAESDKRTRR